VERASPPSVVYGWRWRGSIHGGIFCFRRSLDCWCAGSTFAAWLAEALKMEAAATSASSPSALTTACGLVFSAALG